MLQKFRGVFFLRSPKRRRHADWAHQAKSDKNQQITQDTCSQNPGACFF